MGRSVEDRSIPVVIISDFPSLDAEDEPGIRITSGIHGNEKIAPAFIIQFMEFLASSYAIDSEIQQIINSNYIAFMPILNPDGYEKDIRKNSNNVDLNRDFYNYTRNYPIFSQPESRALRDYKPERFSCGISYHSGDYVVSVPLGFCKSSEKQAEDAELFLTVANKYVNEGEYGFRFKDLTCSVNKAENYVITGGDWYEVDGELSDWSYLEYGTIDITVEISKEKEPLSEEVLFNVYSHNKAGLLNFLEAAKSIKSIKDSVE